MLRAESYDREAYDQLHRWASDESYPYRRMAADAYSRIEDIDSAQPVSITKAPIWDDAVVVTNLTLEAYKKAYEDLCKIPDVTRTEYRRREKLIWELWDRHDIDKGEKLQFLMDVYEKDANLKVVSSIGRIVNREPGADYLPLDTTSIIRWWDNNKSRYQVLKTIRKRQD